MKNCGRIISPFTQHCHLATLRSMSQEKETAQHYLPVLAKSFLAHLQIERGLSPNTCEAYRADCSSFLESLEPGLLRAPEKITEREIFGFLVTERKRGRGVTSVRRTLSALRTFFRF